MILSQILRLCLYRTELTRVSGTFVFLPLWYSPVPPQCPEAVNSTSYERCGPLWGNWPGAASARTFLACGFHFPYSFPTVRLATPAYAEREHSSARWTGQLITVSQEFAGEVAKTTHWSPRLLPLLHLPLPGLGWQRAADGCPSGTLNP